MERALLVAGPIFFVGAVLSALLSLTPGGADEFEALTNGGFEDWDEGAPVGWTAVSSEVERVTEAHTGTYAARLTGDSASNAVLFQNVDVVPGATYHLSGWVRVDDASVDDVQLGLHVPGELPTEDVFIPPSVGQYYQISVGPATVSCQASNIQVRAGIDPAAAMPPSALLDDFTLKVTPPETPCPTATATRTTTPSSTASATATPSRTATPSPTGAPAHTSTPTAVDTPTSTATASRTATATHDAPTASRTATGTPSATSVAPPTPSHGLLVNGGFETANAGSPIGWRTFGGVLQQIESPAHGGDAAGAFFSTTSSTKWLFQTIRVSPGQWYEMEAFAWFDDPGVEAVFLRVSWYESEDGGGSAIATIDSLSELAQPAAAYRWLTTGPVQAPPNARSANVRVLLRPRSAASALIYVDDVGFRSVDAPAPTVTPSATSSATRTSTATVQPSATATVPPTMPSGPTSTPSATAVVPIVSPTAAPSATAAITSTPTRSATPNDTPTATPTSAPDPTDTPTPAPTAPPQPAGAPTPSHGMLVNGGFEAANDEGLTGWRKHGGVLMQVDAPVLSGASAAALFSATSSTKWLFQTVAVEPTAWYEFEVYVHHADPWVASAFLRVSWYTAADGSGSAIDQIDSTSVLEVPDAGYRRLTTGPVRAPPGVHSANARIMLRPHAELGAVIYADDATFRSVAPPPVPLEPLESQANDDPAESGDASRESDRGGGGAGSSGSSGAAGNDEAAQETALPRATGPSPTPMPSPVVRRQSLTVSGEAESDATPDGGDDWWPWLVAGAAGFGAALLTVVWMSRARRDTG